MSYHGTCPYCLQWIGPLFLESIILISTEGFPFKKILEILSWEESVVISFQGCTALGNNRSNPREGVHPDRLKTKRTQDASAPVCSPPAPSSLPMSPSHPSIFSRPHPPIVMLAWGADLELVNRIHDDLNSQGHLPCFSTDVLFFFNFFRIFRKYVILFSLFSGKSLI